MLHNNWQYIVGFKFLQNYTLTRFCKLFLKSFYYVTHKGMYLLVTDYYSSHIFVSEKIVHNLFHPNKTFATSVKKFLLPMPITIATKITF